MFKTALGNRIGRDPLQSQASFPLIVQLAECEAVKEVRQIQIGGTANPLELGSARFSDPTGASICLQWRVGEVFDSSERRRKHACDCLRNGAYRRNAMRYILRYL